MVRHWRLLTFGALFITLMAPVTTPATASIREDCKGGAIIAGCPTVNAHTDSDGVTLSGSATTGGKAGAGASSGVSSSSEPGAGNGTGGSSGSRATSGGQATDAHAAAPKPRRLPTRPGDRCVTTMQQYCVLDFSVPPTAPVASTALAGGSPPSQPLTIRDLAAFRPTPGAQQMEPNGWVVAGLDANFFAIVDRQLVPGSLLGQPARVRFTPVAYRWNYGDGSAAVRTTKGGTWAAFGLRDFDPTPTSHIFGSDGDYVVTLSIEYRAEYQLGSAAFIAVAGTIAQPTNSLRVTVTGAKTVLVDRDCEVAPSGPGC